MASSVRDRLSGSLEPGRRERPMLTSQGPWHSERWVKHLYSRYRNEGTIPSTGRPAGRPRIEIPLEERVAIKYARERFRVGACYLVPVLRRFYGIETNHMRVYR